MQYFLLGLVALTLALVVMHGFTRATPAVVARQVRRGVGVAALAGAAALFVRGLVSIALPLAVLGSWLIWGRGAPWQGGPARPQPGQTSRVVTDHLEMELDHDTGAMHGRVLKGALTGRAIESLTPAELALLWQDCRFTDAPSAQLVEAYLDRIHPTWREDAARTERDAGGARDGRMTAEEAYDVLGLEPGATEEEIRRAHRELMMKLHPDRGGSTYLAAKLNEAKAVLLGS